MIADIILFLQFLETRIFLEEQLLFLVALHDLLPIRLLILNITWIMLQFAGTIQELCHQRQQGGRHRCPGFLGQAWEGLEVPTCSLI